MATEIESLLDYVLQVGGSELIVTEGSHAAVRVGGKVHLIPEAPEIGPGALREFLGSIEGEAGTMVAGPWCGSKWRVRYFREALGNAAVFRPLLEECPAFDALGVPQTMFNLLGLNSGLVIFAGPACSGKTTTATAYVGALCEGNVLCASFLNPSKELPVKRGASLILENSSGSTPEKMEQALRSGANLLWMGDFEEANLIPMLKAAESGALVVCNVTAGSSAGAIDVLLASAAARDNDLVRAMLASVLKAVVVQRLLPGASQGAGSVPAWEVLFNTQNVSTCIRSGELFKLPSVIASSSADGMLSMDECLAGLVRAKYVAREEAEKYVSNGARLG